MLELVQLPSRDSVLDVRIARPSGRTDAVHTLILVHGLPRSRGMGRQAATLLPELAEHLAAESGWTVVTGTLTGVGSSVGTFSPERWRRDLATIVDHSEATSSTIALAAFGFGGALALEQAASNDRIRGVATFATPAHLDRWAKNPEAFHQAVQDAGVVQDPADLPDPIALFDQLRVLHPLASIATIPPRRLLIGNGSDDMEVPPSEARELVAAADGRAELRIIQSAGHQLRADPRMVATLLGWLDRLR